VARPCFRSRVRRSTTRATSASRWSRALPEGQYNAGPGKPNGAQAVDRYAAAYPTKFVKIANGTKSKAPRKGDVLSLSANQYFNDVGHTGVVISSSVNSSGDGTVKAMEENWGGTDGASG
jgi:hypothetical protein